MLPQRELEGRQRAEADERQRDLEELVEKLSHTVEHQRCQISEYVERVGSATIEHASLKLQISTLEGRRNTLAHCSLPISDIAAPGHGVMIEFSLCALLCHALLH